MTTITNIPDRTAANEFADSLKVYDCQYRTGEVLSVDTRTETTTSGGEVKTDARGRIVSSTPVETTNTHYTRICLLTKPGEENEITLINGFAVRPGQIITVFVANKKETPEDRHRFYYFNHNTREENVDRASLRSITTRPAPFGWVAFLLFAAIATGLAFFSLGWWGTIVGLFVGWIAGAIAQDLRVKKIEGSEGVVLLFHVRQQMKDILARGVATQTQNAAGT